MRNMNAIFAFLTSDSYYEWQSDGCYNSSFTLDPFHLEETKNMSLFFILKSVCFSGHVDAATTLHVSLDREDMAGAEVLQVDNFIWLFCSTSLWIYAPSHILRFLIWFNFPDIMVYLRVLSNSSSIRLAQVSIHVHDVLTILTYCPWFCPSLRTDFKILRGEQEKPFEILYLIC